MTQVATDTPHVDEWTENIFEDTAADRNRLPGGSGLIIHDPTHGWSYEGTASFKLICPYEPDLEQDVVERDIVDRDVVDEQSDATQIHPRALQAFQETIELWWRRRQLQGANHTETSEQPVVREELSWETASWPRPLRGLREVILDSRSFLEWEDDWDGEGALAYAEETWTRAADLLTRMAFTLFRQLRLVLQSPAILPGPSGSIDLHWKFSGRELLINVSREHGPIRFYGDSGNGEYPSEGELEPDESGIRIAVWLAGL